MVTREGKNGIAQGRQQSMTLYFLSPANQYGWPRTSRSPLVKPQSSRLTGLHCIIKTIFVQKLVFISKRLSKFSLRLEEKFCSKGRVA